MNMTVGQRFKAIRNEKGLTEEEVAAGVCSHSAVSHLESDRNIPSAKIMAKLAERLGVSLREIMGMQEANMAVDFRIDLIQVYIETGDLTWALEIDEELKRQGVELSVQQEQALLLFRAECFVRTGQHHQALDMLLPFLEQQELQQSVEDETLCEAYNKVGNAYYHLHNFDKSYAVFERGYRVSLRMPVFGAIAARVTKNLGLLCNQLVMKEEARRYLEKAHQFYDSVSDVKGVANTLFALAMTTNEESYLLKAQNLYESLNLIHEVNLVKQHHAYHVQSKQDYKVAVEVLRQTAVDYEKHGDLGMCVYTFSRAVMVCLEHHDLALAREYLKFASYRQENLESENFFMLGYYYRAKAEFHLYLEEFEECIEAAQTSSEMCRKMGMCADGADSLQISARAYELQGNYKQAYKISNKVVELLRQHYRRNN